MPWNGWTSVAFLSHKVLRWLGPAFLILAFLANLVLLGERVYQVTMGCQLLFYLVAFAGMFLPGNGKVIRLMRLTTMFTSMNVALAVGFYRWISGIQRGTWQRTARNRLVGPT